MVVLFESGGFAVVFAAAAAAGGAFSSAESFSSSLLLKAGGPGFLDRGAYRAKTSFNKLAEKFSCARKRKSQQICRKAKTSETFGRFNCKTWDLTVILPLGKHCMDAGMQERSTHRRFDVPSSRFRQPENSKSISDF